ncbi:MAG: tetratricopeptide repeat protein, partial [Chloroflexi bacterium]|nr:tetratricopeptide repeat protein [Chloroflexota bacterium]
MASLKEALSLVKTGRKAEARQALIELIKSDPSEVRAWAALAQVAKDDTEAQRALKQVLKLKPGDPWASE